MFQRGSSAPTVPLAQRAHERRGKRRGGPSSELSVPSAGAPASEVLGGGADMEERAHPA